MNYQDAYKKNMEKIKEQLHTQDPSFESTEEYRNMTELPALEAQNILLTQKSETPTQTVLTNLLLEFHHKMFLAKNRKFALTELFTKSAIPKTIKLDQAVTQENIKRYPLYGFILSLKECFKMKGTKNTCGLFLNNEICIEDTPFVEHFESHGAVIICKANVPQLLFAMESVNYIFGSVANPYNDARTAGGSSGGDACLIALKLVNGAIGSDISGSLRIPAAFCGVSSLMLTPHRVDRYANGIVFERKEWFAKLPEAQSGILSTFGPITNSVADLERLAMVMVDYCLVNRLICPVPWRLTANYKPTKVGVICEFNDLMDLTLTNRRAMKLACHALLKNGIEIVQIDMKDHIENLFIHIAALFNKNMLLIGMLKGNPDLQEPLIPAFANILLMRKLPHFIVRLLASVYPDAKSRIFLKGVVIAKDYNTEYIMGQIFKHRNWLLEHMKRNEVEVFLCPSMMPAPLQNTSSDLLPWVFYMNTWNAFRFPAGQMPITRVQEDEQFYESKFNGKMEKAVKKSMKGSAGLPVGIQVVSTPWNDEKIVEVMRIIEREVKFV